MFHARYGRQERDNKREYQEEVERKERQKEWNHLSHDLVEAQVSLLGAVASITAGALLRDQG